MFESVGVQHWEFSTGCKRPGSRGRNLLRREVTSKHSGLHSNTAANHDSKGYFRDSVWDIMGPRKVMQWLCTKMNSRVNISNKRLFFELR